MPGPRGHAQGWAARLDALAPEVLTATVDDQLQAWRSQVQDLRSTVTAGDGRDPATVQATLAQVETIIEHAEVALGRLVDAPGDSRPAGQIQLARRMEAVEADLSRATQALSAQADAPSLEQGPI